MQRFSDQIRDAFTETVQSGVIDLPKDELLALPIRLRDLEGPGEERDTLWQFLLCRFQAGPRGAWASVVLEAMRPDLIASITSVPAMLPAISTSDIAQQLTAELLTAADDAPADPARWTPHRLMSRATSAVYRWLADEVRGRGGVWPEVPAPDPTTEPRVQLAELVREIEARHIPSRALVLLYRQEFVGRTLAELASEAGISVGALKKRRERAIKSLRRRLAEAA